MLAKLHLIKLFICYTLREERAFRHRGALPKLEAECLRKVFDEMHEEGFADDGLFPKMAEFFLPLTISEQELRTERGQYTQKRETLTKNRDELKTNIDRLRSKLNHQNSIFWMHDDDINVLQKALTNARTTYLQKRSIAAAKTDDKQQQQAQLLQGLNRKWHQEEADFTRDINGKQEEKNNIEKTINRLEKQIDESEARLKNIEKELEKPRKYVDKRLVKPARGLIMYGPPGKFIKK